MALLHDVKKPCFILHDIYVCLIARVANSVVCIGHNDHYVNFCDICFSNHVMNDFMTMFV